MSLKKLFDNGFLKKAKPTRKDIDDKFGVARRNLRDAAIESLSDDTKFRLAYETVIVTAQALLLAEGYRTGTRGSHFYAIESLEHTLGESRKRIILLHALSKKRHITQYDMEGAVSPEELKTMLEEAKRVSRLGLAMLLAKHPEFAE